MGVQVRGQDGGTLAGSRLSLLAFTLENHKDTRFMDDGQGGTMEAWGQGQALRAQ